MVIRILYMVHMPPIIILVASVRILKVLAVSFPTSLTSLASRVGVTLKLRVRAARPKKVRVKAIVIFLAASLLRLILRRV